MPSNWSIGTFWLPCHAFRVRGVPASEGSRLFIFFIIWTEVIAHWFCKLKSFLTKSEVGIYVSQSVSPKNPRLLNSLTYCMPGLCNEILFHLCKKKITADWVKLNPQENWLICPEGAKFVSQKYWTITNLI